MGCSSLLVNNELWLVFLWLILFKAVALRGLPMGTGAFNVEEICVSGAPSPGAPSPGAPSPGAPSPGDPKGGPLENGEGAMQWDGPPMREKYVAFVSGTPLKGLSPPDRLSGGFKGCCPILLYLSPFCLALCLLSMSLSPSPCLFARLSPF